jgi:2-amino-4-hydroxy-6-hydroxymethyldihydropteridine diphosphokinase
MTRVAIGIGSNLGDPPANVRTALDALSQIGEVVAKSHLYRSKPWGRSDQPEFCNAVAIVETALRPRPLLDALKALESELGRIPGERWGPRHIDLDILLYGNERIDQPGLHVPHPRLYERAFAVIPLAEIEPAYAQAVAGLPPGERESVALMSEDEEQASGFTAPLAARVRTLVEAFLETDLVKLRIEDANEDAIELRRHFVRADAGEEHVDGAVGQAPPPPVHLDAIKADLVGIFHLSRPTVTEGEQLEGDRELAYVEALGIRNPVRSLGAGRVASLRAKDGQPVEYGQVLFEIDRG